MLASRLLQRSLTGTLGFTRDDRCVWIAAPLGPTWVIVAHVLRSHQFHPKRHHRRPAAGLAMRRSGTIEGDAGRGEDLPHLGSRLEALRVLVDEVDPLELLGAGNRSGPL